MTGSVSVDENPPVGFAASPLSAASGTSFASQGGLSGVQKPEKPPLSKGGVMRSMTEGL